MTTYIAKFSAEHRLIRVKQHSIFTWKQEGGEIDADLLVDKIKRESALHFFKLTAGEQYPIALEDIQVAISKTATFSG